MGSDSSIPFRQFGPRFLEDLFTVEFVQAQIAQAVPRRIYKDMQPISGGWIEPSVGPLTREVGPCELVFRGQLTLRFRMANPANMIPGAPFGDLTPVATAPLVIRLKAFAPGVLKVVVDPISGSDVQFDGGAWGLIAGFVADAINQELASGEVDRTFDLERMVLESTAAEAPWASTNSKLPAMPVGKGTAVEGIVGPGTSASYGVMLAKGEQIRFLVYCQYVEQPGLMDSAGANFDILDPSDRVWESTFMSLNQEAWGDERNLWSEPPGDTWHEAPRTGLYRFRISSPGRNAIGGGYPLRYLIKQVRGNVVHGEPICFDAFGTNFMGAAINPDLILLQLRRQIPAGMTQNDGTVRVEAKIDVTGVTRLPSDPEWYLVFEAAVALDMKVFALGCGWHVPALAKLRLRAWTAGDPVAIVVKPDQVQEADVTVDMGRVEAIEGSAVPCGLDVLEKAIGTVVRGQLVGQLRDQVEAAGIQRQVIAKMRDDMIGLPPAQHPGVRPAKRPSREAAPPLFSGTTFQGELTPGPGAYFPVSLEKGQTVDVSFRGRWKQRDFAGDQIVSVGLCDEEKGKLESMYVLTSGKLSCRGRLQYTAPAGGQYYIRLRLQYGAEPPAAMDFTMEAKKK